MFIMKVYHYEKYDINLNYKVQENNVHNLGINYKKIVKLICKIWKI